MTITETIARAAANGLAAFAGEDPITDEEWLARTDEAQAMFDAIGNRVITALEAAGYAIVRVEEGGEPLRIPRSLYDALGNLVSDCADQKDIYPDTKIALEVITDSVNLLYACIEDGVFGPLEITTGKAKA